MCKAMGIGLEQGRQAWKVYLSLACMDGWLQWVEWPYYGERKGYSV